MIQPGLLHFKGELNTFNWSIFSLFFRRLNAVHWKNAIIRMVRRHFNVFLAPWVGQIKRSQLGFSRCISPENGALYAPGEPVLLITICYGFWNHKSFFAIHPVPSPMRKVACRLQLLSLLTYVDVRTAQFPDFSMLIGQFKFQAHQPGMPCIW